MKLPHVRFRLQPSFFDLCCSCLEQSAFRPRLHITSPLFVTVFRYCLKAHLFLISKITHSPLPRQCHSMTLCCFGHYLWA